MWRGHSCPMPLGFPRTWNPARTVGQVGRGTLWVRRVGNPPGTACKQAAGAGCHRRGGYHPAPQSNCCEKSLSARRGRWRVPRKSSPGSYSSLGSNSPAGACSAQSTIAENGVGLGVDFNDLRAGLPAYGTRPAAGYTTAEVPITRKTSAEAAACSASFIMPSGRGSPNQTTAGRASPPQWQCGGILGNGARRRANWRSKRCSASSRYRRGA